MEIRLWGKTYDIIKFGIFYMVKKNGLVGFLLVHKINTFISCRQTQETKHFIHKQKYI